MTTTYLDVRKTPRLAATAAAIGSALEYYDFFIFASAAALVFPTLFFPTTSPFVSVLIALATFGAGYVVRPLAALLFGHFGDRIGRKSMLVFTMVTMGVSTILIGLLPTAEQIGIAAPILLVLLRLIQGASAAGEFAGAMTTNIEHSTRNRRAFFGAWTVSGIFVGASLSTVVFLGVAALPKDIQLSWGWRIPFLLSAVVVLVGYVVRRRLTEPPEFDDLRKANQTHRAPLIVVATKHWRPILLVAGCTLVSTTLTVTVFVMSYSTKDLGVTPTVILLATLISQVLAILTSPLFGVLADRVGIRKVYVTGTLACAVLIHPYLYMVGTGSTILIILANILILSVAFASNNALCPTFWGQAFDTKVRYSGLALGSTIALPIVGLTPAIVAGLAQAGGLPLAAVFVSVCCLIACGCAIFLPNVIRDDEASASLTQPTGTNQHGSDKLEV